MKAGLIFDWTQMEHMIAGVKGFAKRLDSGGVN